MKFAINVAVRSTFKAHAHTSIFVSHGIPILSIASIEGIFHQAFVLRATKYRVYTMTDLTRQCLVSSCFFYPGRAL